MSGVVQETKELEMRLPDKPETCCVCGARVGSESRATKWTGLRPVLKRRRVMDYFIDVASPAGTSRGLPRPASSRSCDSGCEVVFLKHIPKSWWSIEHEWAFR